MKSIKHLVIRRTEPGSPVLVSAIGSDLDATISHKEAGDLGFLVSVEDIGNPGSESEASDVPFFDSFSHPPTMTAPAELGDLILAMQDLMQVQLQHMAQTMQLQQ